MKMKLILLGLLSAFSSTQALAANKIHPGIIECRKIEREYGNWAIDFVMLVGRNSSDVGGPIDASVVMDIRFAMNSAKTFVYTNIQKVQRASYYDREPNPALCRKVSHMAKKHVEQYASYVLSSVHPSDRAERERARSIFREELAASTNSFTIF